MSTNINIFLMYLFYGLAFFTIGVAVVSKYRRHSKLELSRLLWLLASFGFVHALHEWSELYLVLKDSEEMTYQRFSLQFFPQFYITHDLQIQGMEIVSAVLLLGSYLLLLAFGLAIIIVIFPRWWKWHAMVPLALFTGFVMAIWVTGKEPFCCSGHLSYMTHYVRHFFGFPGAALAGIALILYSRRVRNISVNGARSLVVTGVTLVVYGVLTGIIPSGTVIPTSVVDIRIEVLRASSRASRAAGTPCM
ncbi:hypothetical protein HNR37_000568 [Desulfurispira natronophila]|uniref:Uncharacterized protein n=1 Tax=Desulfurispira natronophila TaxID=682562 RepID=A0A7W7Y393_9BACT|nr:hypothetical protein [Desulfurispira natronophila]